jgi:sec-independent protein translocase protein TatA
MGGLSPLHLLLLGAVVLLVFGGKGKISELMGDFAKGIKSFKKGLSDDDSKTAATATPVEAPRAIDHQPAEASRVSDPHKIG